MHIMKKTAVLLLAVLLLPVMAHAADNDVVIRIDRDDPDAWKGELDNVRFLQEEGMSGSAQFSEEQFHDLAEQLREQSDDVWVIDCRLESHGLINGIAVSWSDVDNAANQGKTAEEVEAEEESLVSLEGTDVVAYITDDGRLKDSVDFSVEKWETERELVDSEDMHYLRLACPDHCWPPAEEIDSFIDFAKDLDEDAWLHFHCQAGSGRTGAFMTIYEMMQKTDTPVEEILQHQADTGSGNLVDRAKPEKSPVQKERCVLVRSMYQYICASKETGYDIKWSEWLDEHSQTITMQVGDKLDGKGLDSDQPDEEGLSPDQQDGEEIGSDQPDSEGFSSDQLVVSDALEAVAPGRATVLVGDEVYFITVSDE